MVDLCEVIKSVCQKSGCSSKRSSLLVHLLGRRLSDSAGMSRSCPLCVTPHKEGLLPQPATGPLPDRHVPEIDVLAGSIPASIHSHGYALTASLTKRPKEMCHACLSETSAK